MQHIRILLVLCFLNCFLGNSFSQVSYSSRPISSGGEIAYISLSAGASVPLDQYRNKDIFNVDAGYAKTGLMLDLDIAYNLTKGFGIMASLYGQQNQIESKSTADLFAPTQATGTSGASLSNRNVSSKPWYLGSGLLGFYLKVKLSNYVYLRPRALVGVASASTPEVYVEVIAGSKAGTWTKQERTQSDPAFAYLLGFDFKFDISSNACLIVNIDYVATAPEFNDITVISSDIIGSYKYSRSQDFKMLNFGIGFGVNLYK